MFLAAATSLRFKEKHYFPASADVFKKTILSYNHRTRKNLPVYGTH
jgi:hypothetical protein